MDVAELEGTPGVFRTSTGQDEVTLVAAAGFALGLLVTIAFTAATVFLLFELPLLAVLTAPGMIGSGLFLRRFGRELRARMRRMGGFVLDARSHTLARDGAAAPMRVMKIRASAFMAPSFSRLDSSWWVLVEVDGGAAFRVARGSWAEVRPLLARWSALGLPVEGADDDCLLRTSAVVVSRRGPARFEFECRERRARVTGPLVVAFWIGLASLFTTSFVVAAVNGPLDPAAALFAVPMALFFGFGIVVGVVNTVSVYRRSGVFVLDVTGWSLARDGVVLTDRDPIARFRLGAPGLLGVRRSRVLGPQLLAVSLRSGRWFCLVRGLPGDVRFAADVLRGAGVPIED